MRDKIAKGGALPVTGRGFVAPLPGAAELEHLQRAVRLLGNVESLARAANLPPSSLGRMVKGQRAVYAEAALAIEHATEGVVLRWELRPDLWSPAVDVVDLTPMVGRGADLTGPDLAAFEEARFKAYQDAFHKNAANPNLVNAAALVAAWNAFADAVGVDRV